MKIRAISYLSLIALVALFTVTAHTQTFSVIHAFTGIGGEGQQPQAGVTIRGNALYGTTGTIFGTVYQLVKTGSSWHLPTLSNAVSFPMARVVFGPDGHLYGTAAAGGSHNYGEVFKLTPSAGICKTVSCYWTVRGLYDFGSWVGDGLEPWNGDLIWDQQGNIFGTSGGGTYGEGAVYQLMPSENGGIKETVVYNFTGPRGDDGEYPMSGLVSDNKGNFFGTTYSGGTKGVGTIYQLSYSVGAGWTERVLYSFQNASDGEDPIGGLILDSSGNLYGTAADGGSGGAGTFFELSPAGDTWMFKVLYSFSRLQGYNCGPWATLTMDAANHLYGTTHCGGIHNNGSVFELSNTQNGWVYTSLHDFTGLDDGGSPVSNVTIDTDGTLYGTAQYGGDLSCVWNSSGCGVVWMIKP